MSPDVVGVVGIILMLMIFLTGMPVTYVMALVGWLGFSYIVSPEAGLQLLARDMVGTFQSSTLVVVPLFTLMGQFALQAGVSKRLYEVAHRFTGAMPGGLAMATVLACTGFGAVCGSSTATAATMATVGLPEMKSRNYSPALATGAVASGGSLGMLMPPSVVLIVYGVLTEASIGRLFVAGIIPALLIAHLFILAIAAVCWLRPKACPVGESYSWADKFAALREVGEVILVFLLVLGGLVRGWFTEIEAGGVGAMLMLMVGLARRQMTWLAFRKALNDTLWTSCMTMMLVAGAVVFGHFLTITRIPFAVAELVAGLDWPAWAVIVAIGAVYLVGGCIIDALALVMLTVPIFLPIVTGLGFDTIWFGVIIVLLTQMGVITPPVGINVYVVQGIARDVTLEAIFKGALPFLVALIVGMLILVAFPAIVTWLPDQVYQHLAVGR